MTAFGDAAARHRILTDLDATLLVESAAGTGKTALMAGRLTMLLARGTPPSAIAAITFTELAASELSLRIHRYVADLVAGEVPGPLAPALPGGVAPAQRHALARAEATLDELTTTTIHAFCQTIISGYAVEADIDPGARILDAVTAPAAFDLVFERWLKRRLNAPERPGDPIATLTRDDPRHVVTTLQALSRFRLHHRGARPPPADLSGRPDIDLADAVAEFRRFVSSAPPEPKTIAVVRDLETLAGFYAGSFATAPGFDALWRLAHPPRLSSMRGDSRDLVPPRSKARWQRLGGDDRGARLHAAATAHFERANACYRTVLGRIATALVSQLSHELDEVLDDYGAFKRAAAVLDFDDLLHHARDLVRRHDDVREALAARWQHIFVDEFQDTDPVQAEILFRIAADGRPGRWQDAELRDGALFMVGDPKQAIYRFRGADVSTYAQARAAVARRRPGGILKVTANFRSRPAILAHVNRVFAAPLSADGQPGYVALTPVLAAGGADIPAVGRIAVAFPPDSKPGRIRDAEADAVADLCLRLVGHFRIAGADGALEPLGPGGIALITATSTEIHRYERALEERGLPVASHGRNLLRRQEVQDLLALARVLADPADTLAFGALMRGPLVGVTEEELLDITAALAAVPGAAPRFSVRTDPAHVSHPGARRALSIVRDLSARARATTPALLIAEAVERLSVRPILTLRDAHRGARAAANVEAFIERARPYGVRGLKKFVRDLDRQWREGATHHEGVVDSHGDAIEIITIHSAKGLEWPVVIPINACTVLRNREPLVHRPSDDTLHWLLGDVVPPGLADALDAEAHSLARERERLWYVACTRARELLAIPDMREADQRSWARVVDLGHRELPALALARRPPRPPAADAGAPNRQTAAAFEAEAAAVAAAAAPLTWRRPSDHDGDRRPVLEGAAVDPAEAPETEWPAGAGIVRGLVLHKLMEEVLTGELGDDPQLFAARARILIAELTAGAGAAPPDPGEIAATAARTLDLPDIKALRPHLVPEWPVYAVVENTPEAVTALSGRVDAIAVADGEPYAVIDWKSDVRPGADDMRDHAGQLQDYLDATGTARGAVVYMTPGIVRWVSRRQRT